MKKSIILFLVIFLSSCVVINNDNSEISDIKNKLEKQQQTLDNQSEKIEKLESISS
jgi:predicted Holliday junction resolvase-like endonuclease